MLGWLEVKVLFSTPRTFMSASGTRLGSLQFRAKGLRFIGLRVPAARLCVSMVQVSHAQDQAQLFPPWFRKSFFEDSPGRHNPPSACGVLKINVKRFSGHHDTNFGNRSHLRLNQCSALQANPLRNPMTNLRVG